MTWLRHYWRHNARINYLCGPWADYTADDYFKRSLNTNKNCQRISILNVVTSPSWRQSR